MITHLKGVIHRLEAGQLSIDVQGVGYLVHVPVDVWETLPENAEHTLYIQSYIREDRFDLYGFIDLETRTLFNQFIQVQGVGPRIALEICAVSTGLLQQAASSNDTKLLTSIKGIGKKMAEKLLIELKSILEKHPHLFHASPDGQSEGSIDTDAMAALQTLGYDSATIIEALQSLPSTLKSTEERVTAALKAM